MTSGDVGTRRRSRQAEAEFDIAIVGAGTAGLPAVVEAAALDMRVLLVEASDQVGGTLPRSWAQMSAAGTSPQAARGIRDTPDLHFDDVMRISKGTADPVMVRKAVTNAPSTIEWLLENGFDLDPASPAVLHFHEPYTVARTYWGRKGGVSVLETLMPLYRKAAQRAGVTVRMRTALEGLCRDGSGRVDGVQLRGPNGEIEEHSAGDVLLATGGYAGNPELFPRLTKGAGLAGPGAPTSTGSGILAALDAGARLRGQELFLPTYGGILRAGSNWETVHLDDYPVLTPQTRPPYEIHVNARGERFVAEDAESVDVRENALLAQPGLAFWIVFDEETRRQAPPLLPSWSDEALTEAFRSHPSFSMADDLRGLGELAGIDPEGLLATAKSWNDHVAAGHDPLGRRRPRSSLRTAPFYAIRNHGTALKSPAGLAVDKHLRVVGEAGPLANLYAAGEAIGGSTLSGKSFVSGMSVTPGLTFGRLAVREIAGVGTISGSS